MANNTSMDMDYEGGSIFNRSDMPDKVRQLLAEADTFLSDAEMTQKLINKHGRSVIQEIVHELKKHGFVAD